MGSAMKKYAAAFAGSPAEEYIANKRGLGSLGERFNLGFVEDSIPGHDRARGMLAVPYLRPAGTSYTATIRFRCIQDHDCKEAGHGKYYSLPGDRPRLYNSKALIGGSPYVGIAEGEMDALSAEACGIPCVGIAGVSGWRDHFLPGLSGYNTVYIFGDNDDAGQGAEFADKVAAQVPNAKVILMPSGHDLNSAYREFGPEAVRNMIGL